MPVFGGSGGQTTSTRTIWANQPQCPPKTCYKNGQTVQAPNLVPPAYYAIADRANTIAWHVGGGVHRAQKISGTAATYDASAVSSVGATGDFVLRVNAVVINGGVMVGMNSDPLADNDYASIDYTWQNPYATLGGIFESGVFISTPGGSTYHWIWRIGTTLYYGRGADLATAQTAPDRTVAGVTSTLYFDSSLLDVADEFEAVLYDLAATSLTAAQGTFSYSGQAANLNIGTDLAAAQGAFTYTGQAANLTAARILTASQATFTYTGQAAAFPRGYAMTAAAGSFAYSGQSAGLLAGRLMAAAAGNFTYSGQAVNLTRSLLFGLSAGAFLYTGQALALVRGLSLITTVGIYTVQGQPATLSFLSGGRIKASNGLLYAPKPVKVWLAGVWTEKPLKRWDGAAWVRTRY